MSDTSSRGAAGRRLRLLGGTVVRLGVAVLVLALLPVSPLLGDKSKKKPQEVKLTPPDAALNAYIARVRAEHAAAARTPGSIWSADGRLTRLSADVRASHIHDPIAIVVSESLTASTDGSVKNSRATNATSTVSQLLGKLSGASSLNNLLNQSSTSGLTAQGQSVTDSSLVTTIGGEVVDELPNGMLVIQAVRQLTFSQQTQTIRLRGLVRPEDISNYNQVTSTSISDLELEVVGKGIVNDYTYRQNPIVRFLEKLLVF